MKSTLGIVTFLLATFFSSVAFGAIAAYLQARGERAPPEIARLSASLGAGAVVASIVVGVFGNRRVRRAPKAQDREAKSFAPVPGSAVVYIFRDAFIGRLLGIDVQVDGQILGQTRGGTFYRLVLAPGEHRVASRDAREDASSEYRFEVGAGSVTFLEHRFRMGALSVRHDIAPAIGGAAMRRIGACRLLAPTAAFEH